MIYESVYAAKRVAKRKMERQVKTQPARPTSIFNLKPSAKVRVVVQRASILIVGESQASIDLCCQLRERADLRLLTSYQIEHGLELLSSNSDLALVLLLHEGSGHALPDQVQSIFACHGNATLSVLVRSSTQLPPAISNALWHLGVADLSFYQPCGSVELLESIDEALANWHRQTLLAKIPALSGAFNSVKTLRELAQLSLQVVHELGFPTRDGLFCYASSKTNRCAMLIAGTGCYARQSYVPVEQLQDPLGKNLIQSAMQQGRSCFAPDAVAIYLCTADANMACIYFSLDKALQPWQRGVLQTFSNMIGLAIDRAQMAQQLLRTQHATIITLSTLAEYRDVDTCEHVVGVASMTTEIAYMLAHENSEIDASFLEQVGLASILHDTGKVAIPDSILLKPGPLDVDERREMEQHTVLGYDMLISAARRTDDNGLLTMSAQVARHHHERFDGKGYPDGLRGEEIPLAARIVALVDVYHALVGKRSYKLPWPQEKALELIRSESGHHFDPRVVDALVRLDDLRTATRHIQWSGAMSVGNEDLDGDHQRLIEIINRLWTAESMGNRQIIEFVLDDLVKYTELHFAREEQLLEQVGFAEMQSHIKSHRAICRHLEKIRWEYFQGIRDDIRSGLLEFLTDWLKKHILEEDRAYSRYFAMAA